MVLALWLSGCVTDAEQVASQSDISWLARTIDRDPFSNLDPDDFQRQAERMVRTPIDFHGIVLSEEGNPLKGATIKQTIFDRLASPFEFPYFSFVAREEIQTGTDGRFRVKARGAGMYVLVEVPGWQPVTAPRKLYVYAKGLDQTVPFPTKETPAVFQFEPRPPEAELRPIKTGALKLRKDGAPLEVSLRTVAPYGVDPGTGEAIIACERTLDHAAPDALFDWWCELTIPGGGFQPFQLDMDQAPETGYVESGRLEYAATDPDWDDRADRDLIIKFADGKYGFMTVSMRMDGDFYVAFDGVWSSTGSTWLD
ncbi:MAG: carboxypeptidase-like regulatory domain-containing protein [Pseudomonadales bacterium]